MLRSLAMNLESEEPDNNSPTTLEDTGMGEPEYDISTYQEDTYMDEVGLE